MSTIQDVIQYQNCLQPIEGDLIQGELIKQLFEIAKYAPSSKNERNMLFILVQGQTLKQLQQQFQFFNKFKQYVLILCKDDSMACIHNSSVALATAQLNLIQHQIYSEYIPETQNNFYLNQYFQQQQQFKDYIIAGALGLSQGQFILSNNDNHVSAMNNVNNNVNINGTVTSLPAVPSNTANNTNVTNTVATSNSKKHKHQYKHSHTHY